MNINIAETLLDYQHYPDWCQDVDHSKVFVPLGLHCHYYLISQPRQLQTQYDQN
jgi:hypothetical protein